MDLNFEHPKWIAVGLFLFILGLVLVSWARRNNRSRELSGATAEAAIRALRREGQPAGERKAVASNNFRNSMSQFFGTVGFMCIIAGLLTALLGALYLGPSPF